MKEDEALERRIKQSRLYDLYAPLLTERQRRIYELHELDDLSLSEISAELGISRQGVSDQLQRVRDRLEEIEGLLGFAATLGEIASRARDIIDGHPAQDLARDIIDKCIGKGIGNV